MTTPIYVTGAKLRYLKKEQKILGTDAAIHVNSECPKLLKPYPTIGLDDNDNVFEKEVPNSGPVALTFDDFILAFNAGFKNCLHCTNYYYPKFDETIFLRLFNNNEYEDLIVYYLFSNNNAQYVNSVHAMFAHCLHDRCTQKQELIELSCLVLRLIKKHRVLSQPESKKIDLYHAKIMGLYII